MQSPTPSNGSHRPTGRSSVSFSLSKQDTPPGDSSAAAQSHASLKLWAPSGYHRIQEQRLRKQAQAYRAANRRGRQLADLVVLILLGTSLVLTAATIQRERQLNVRERQLLERAR